MPPDPASEARFSPDYATARERFLTAAEGRAARVASHPIEARGPKGEELAVDTAYLGPEAPERLLAVSSGVHGVEGYAGSALQLQLLEAQLDGLSLPADTGLLLVHAVNPHGFAWRRRVNERNVDLNRNFLSHPDDHVANPSYEGLFDAINPTRLDEETDQRSREKLLGFAGEHGFGELQRVLTCGQYVHARGMQFGGHDAEASNAILRRIAAEDTRGAGRIAWVDVHTGLGPYGIPEMITECPTDHPAYRLGKAWYGDSAKSTQAGVSVSAKLSGVMETGLEESLPGDCELVAYTAEFGTYDGLRVFWAMRADNWLAAHGEEDTEKGQEIKRELVEVFRPDDPEWRAKVLVEGARVVEQTRRGLLS